jgi:hypothetical protein
MRTRRTLFGASGILISGFAHRMVTTGLLICVKICPFFGGEESAGAVHLSV